MFKNTQKSLSYLVDAVEKKKKPTNEKCCFTFFLADIQDVHFTLVLEKMG